MKKQNLFVLLVAAVFSIYFVIFVVLDPDFIFPILKFRDNTQMDPYLRQAVEQRLKDRKTLLLRKCSELGLDKPGKDPDHKPSSWEFLVNTKYHLIWCNIFKSGSTSWLHNFNLLAGYSPEFLSNATDVPLILARRKYPRVKLDELHKAQNNSITFIIVRHPFARLLSAYVDKMMHPLPGSHHDKLNKLIIYHYRQNQTGPPNPNHATFKEFISWFLIYVRVSSYIEIHLVKQTKFCTPCLINFDMILKLETLDEDQLYLIEMVGLRDVISLERRNTGKANNTMDMLMEYYSQITLKQLRGLHRYYRDDFEVFGYSVEPFYKLLSDKLGV